MREQCVLGLTYEKPGQELDPPTEIVCEALNDIAVAGHELGHALGKAFGLSSEREGQLAEGFEFAAKRVSLDMLAASTAHLPRKE